MGLAEQARMQAQTFDGLDKLTDQQLASMAQAGGTGGASALREIERRKVAVAEGKVATEQAKVTGEQQRIIGALSAISEGRGTAHAATMQQVNQGNNRIRALSAGGRGGLNAGLNASNAIGISTAAGSQQAKAAREAEKTQARAALGQAISQGQDMNVAENRAVLDALGQTPKAGNPLEAAGSLASLAQGAYSAYGGNGNADEKKKNQQSAGYGRW